jgi:hypothetical protein
MIHPISFSIADEKIVKTIPDKTKFLSNLIPGDTSTYIYNTEEAYYNEYKSSYFAVTCKKAGWDCMRHYEILANGCIPYFVDIEKCPKNTMYLCPKQLFIEAKEMYDTITIKKTNVLSIEDINEYYILLTKLLEYTRNHLTTNKMAKYILHKSHFENISNVLFLSDYLRPDYLRCSILHGFKQIFGEKCHDYPKIPHIYKSNDINFNNLYGKGFTYTNLLDPILHNDNLDASLVNDIINKKYDIVVYGSYHRGMPLYDLVCSIYKPNEIILLCGEDIHCCNYSDFVRKGHTIFVREL